MESSACTSKCPLKDTWLNVTLKPVFKPAVMVTICHPSIQEVEARGKQVQGQPGLQGKSLFQNKKDGLKLFSGKAPSW